MLVAADLVFTIIKPKKTDEIRRPYDVDRLSSSSTPQSRASLTCWVLARTTSPASGSDCARSFANRRTKDESIRKNIRQPWLSEDTYTSSNLTLQRNVNRTALSDADFKAYSRPERKLTETITCPVLQMKCKRTFTTTTRDQHSVPLRHLQVRSTLNPSCPASTKQMTHHVAPMRRLCSAGQNTLRLPLITFQQPPLGLGYISWIWIQTRGLMNLLATKSSEPSKSWRMAVPLVPMLFPTNCWMCFRPCRPRLTLYLSKSGDLA